MKNKKVQKILAISAIACMATTTTGCSAKEIIDSFNPVLETPMLAYGMYENIPTNNITSSGSNSIK